MSQQPASTSKGLPRPAAGRARLVSGLTLAGLGTVLAAVGPAGAHDLGTTETQLTLGDRRFEILMQCDLDALALGAAPAADDAELATALAGLSEHDLDDVVANLALLFRRRVRLLAGDERLDFEVDFPDRAAGTTVGSQPPTFLGLTARLRGRLPDDHAGLRFRASRAFPAVSLTVLDAAGSPLFAEAIPRGEESATFADVGTVAATTNPEGAGLRAALWALAFVVVGALAAILRNRRPRAP